MRDAKAAYAQVAATPVPAIERFDPSKITALPEIAQRYFSHAIAPGTPLHTVSELEMEGTFLLGEKGKFQAYDMSARQVLNPPDQFVWLPKLRSEADDQRLGRAGPK
jgi:hypothetical protein